MFEKVYITSKQMATFVCPKCQRSKTANVSKYANMDKTVKVNVKCPCGHAYTAILEKRKRYRKETDLPGSFIHLVDGRQVGKGVMTVRDISLSGLKLKVNTTFNGALGDRMLLEFHLDDAQHTLIKRTVIIRNLYPPYIGTEFAPNEPVDKALGFYLFT
jgi:hypothetical protein